MKSYERQILEDKNIHPAEVDLCMTGQAYTEPPTLHLQYRCSFCWHVSNKSWHPLGHQSRNLQPGKHM